MSTLEAPPWTLGWRLRRALDHARIDVQDMAKYLGVHRTTITRWFNDEVTPKAIYVEKWAAVCEVPYEWLAGDDVLTPPAPKAARKSREIHSYPHYSRAA